MGLFDDLGNLWNDVEHAGSMVFHSMEDVVSHLGTLGVPFFASLPQFVQFIVSIGENPFTFLPRLVGVASGHGANPVQTLEELAQGILTEGSQAFAQKQVKRVIDPIIQQVQAHTQVSQSIGALHQNTITQVQQKLTALRTGNDGSLGLQGDFATALDTHFQVVQTSVNTMTAPLNPSGSGGGDGGILQQYNRAQAAIDQAFVFGLEVIVGVAIGLAIVDIIILVLEIIAAAIAGALTIEFAGGGGLLVGGAESLIDVGLIAAELSFIGDLILADAAIWAVATLINFAVYEIRELIYQHQHALVTSRPILPNPELTPEGQKVVDDLFGEFGGTIPKELLGYLVKWLGTSALAKATIRCLFQNGYLDLSGYTGTDPRLNDANNNAWTNVNDHLDPNDLEGAWKENNPSQVDPSTIPPGSSNVSGGDHLKEVTDALNSIKRLISNLTNVINVDNAKIAHAPDPGAPDILNLISQRDHLQTILDIWKKTRDFILSKIGKGTPPPTGWSDQGKLPLIDDLLNASPCKVPDAKYYK